MKRILITGTNSYIGKSLYEYLKDNENYKINFISLKDKKWEDISFLEFDVVYHVAAIVHQKKADETIYNVINRDLTYNLAKKAKSEGVNQFIFVSTMAVYGLSSGYINNETTTNPKTYYAKSKLEAENLIMDMGNRQFKVSILRIPMVYGSKCKGNYDRLSRLSKKISFFPKINNSRSMIYIDNLNEFVKLIIDSELYGIYFPQNSEYVCTSNMVKKIGKANNKNIIIVPGLNPIISLLSRKINILEKIFGNLVYSKTLPGGPENMTYQKKNFDDSIEESERNI